MVARPGLHRARSRRRSFYEREHDEPRPRGSRAASGSSGSHRDRRDAECASWTPGRRADGDVVVGHPYLGEAQDAMAGIGGSHNDAFMSGVAHQVNDTRANAGSLTLNDTASIGDQGLDETSARWAATDSPRRARHDRGRTDDGSSSAFQRDSGGYAPGSMTEFQDQLDQGSDDIG